jgi:hypothetical protein
MTKKARQKKEREVMSEARDRKMKRKRKLDEEMAEKVLELAGSGGMMRVGEPFFFASESVLLHYFGNR